MVFSTNDSKQPHLVFINGRVLTMDPEETLAESVSVRGSRIEAIGPTKEIERLIKADTEVIDLKGSTMMPGFIEAHGHFPFSGLSAVAVNLNSPPMGNFRSIPQVIEALRQKAAETEKGKWIIGFGYDDTLVEEKKMLTRQDLDAVSAHHPVYVVHISAHLGSLNTAGLKIYNITAETPNPDGGVIRKESVTGNPSGVLEEKANYDVRESVFKLSPQEMLSMLQQAVRDYAKHGVTTVQSGNAREPLFTALSNASKNGVIPLRIIIWPNIESAEALISGEIDTDQYNSDRYQIGAVKLTGDGSIQCYTAYLTQPYHTPFENNPAYCGYPVLNRSSMTEMIKKLHRAGLQVAVHANGDAAIDNVIAAISEAQISHPRSDARHIIVHCQTVRDDQLSKMQELDITPSFFPAHIYYWGERHRSLFLGPERTEGMNPLRTALKKGLRFTIHLDTPVAPINQLLLVWTAVNRQSYEGTVIGPDERISAIEALKAVTIDAAWQVFQEEKIGSLEVGKWADMVILSDNPLNNPTQIKEIGVLKTYVGGRLVFDSDDPLDPGYPE